MLTGSSTPPAEPAAPLESATTVVCNDNGTGECNNNGAGECTNSVIDECSGTDECTGVSDSTICGIHQ